MNLNKANLTVGLAASKDVLKMHLMSVHVTKDYTEATNGNILARVSLPRQFPIDEVPAPIETEEAQNLNDFVIPADAAMKVKPLKSKHWPCLDGALYLDVKKTNDNDNAYFCTTDLSNTNQPVIQKRDVTYPDTNRVIPDDKDFSISIAYNIEYLITLLTIAKSTGADSVIMEFIDSSKPCKLTASNNGQNFVGLLMPLRQ
jgi:DNA polymerase III sliding clamp (beta) subunit (PCNA family)